MKFQRTTILYILIVILNGSCEKDNNPSGVPYVEVNFTLNLDDPELLKLKTIGNWEYITGGSRGIVVYRISNEEFVAFDRHCTYDIAATCSQLDVDVTDVRLNDYDCCGSEFSLQNGTALKGPATLSLRKYNTSLDGNTLIITN